MVKRGPLGVASGIRPPTKPDLDGHLNLECNPNRV